jgi:hypothetical protein
VNAADERDERGRFLPGNPGGPGNPNVRRQAEYAAAVREAVTPERVAALMRRFLKAALEGDVAAARLVFDRVLGKAGVESTDSVPVDLPEIATAQDIVAAASCVVAALRAGKISADEATKLMAIVETFRRTLETADLEVRLAELERSAGR